MVCLTAASLRQTVLIIKLFFANTRGIVKFFSSFVKNVRLFSFPPRIDFISWNGIWYTQEICSSTATGEQAPLSTTRESPCSNTASAQPKINTQTWRQGLETSLRIYLVDISSAGGSVPVGLMTAGEFHPSLQTWLKQVWPMETKQGQAWVASTLSPLLGSTPHFLDHYLQNETELGPVFPALNSHSCLFFGLLC